VKADIQVHGLLFGARYPRDVCRFVLRESLQITIKYMSLSKAPRQTAKHFRVNFYNHPCVTQECVPLAFWLNSLEFGLGGERSVLQLEGIEHSTFHSKQHTSALTHSNELS